MALTLYLHPLASFCHKVLIALYENGTEFNQVIVDLGDPGETAALTARWPVGKIPVLHDGARDRIVPETSIIIEYLQQHYPGPTPMLPTDAEHQLDARLWERFFDLYISVPMQKIVTDRIRPEGGNDPVGVADARRTLDTAYQMIERQLADKTWAMGADFTIADCAAAPGLYYASIVHPFAGGQRNLAAYFERLVARPSVRRTINEARPYFHFFPYREAMPERFLHDEI
ncbi:glutathione S-transferase family protein [Aminobacter anthyllidis]|uniref:glutathione S-transferase family protein n=1 Tax=Aminobacter anthyllidis TaxID=1035067 RepID=UPI0024584F10|nr:glutathione S-transferase family protein [Aminobacter anthyllidis]MDH4987987.1 glutathione S-transferase family protein [Aminobacter anthyllidis]